MKTDQEWLMDHDWLMGTRSNSRETVIVNRANDEHFMERIQREIHFSVVDCQNENPRVRITIEVLDNGL